MKYTFLPFLILLLFAYSGFGQIAKDNKQWNIAEATYNGTDNTYITHVYKFENDTSINNLTYNKLYRANFASILEWELFSFIKESENKVYRLDLNSQNETLIFDFSLQQLDTFKTELGSILLVDSVKSINYAGMSRKAIYLHNTDPEFKHDQITWIEGIGNDRLFTRSGEQLAGGRVYSLLCYYENDEQKYQNPDYNSCSIITGHKELNAISENIIALNVVGGGFLKLKSNYSGTIIFYQMNGQLIQQFTFTDNEELICLPIQNKPVLFNVKSQSGLTQTGKIMIH